MAYNRSLTVADGNEIPVRPSDHDTFYYVVGVEDGRTGIVSVSVKIGDEKRSVAIVSYERAVGELEWQPPRVTHDLNGSAVLYSPRTADR